MNQHFKGGDCPIFGINKVINPKKDSKYSPNLYKFLTYSGKHYTNIFRNDEGIFFIGLRDKNNVWGGAKLMEVFCRGSKADTFSYSPSITKEWKDVTNEWWQQYLKLGKLIYDTKNHSLGQEKN